jgi:hypothetical protein
VYLSNDDDINPNLLAQARLAGQLRTNTVKVPTPFQLQLDAFKPTVDAKLLDIVKWRKAQREAMAIEAESEHDQPENRIIHGRRSHDSSIDICYSCYEKVTEDS